MQPSVFTNPYSAASGCVVITGVNQGGKPMSNSKNLIGLALVAVIAAVLLLAQTIDTTILFASL
jgi:hypothetical protein